MRTYRITDNGQLLCDQGTAYAGEWIDAELVSADHLGSHVESFVMAGGEAVKVLVTYSCHCWTSGYDDYAHTGMLRIMDGTRARVFDSARYEASLQLSDHVRGFQRHKVYVTQSDRNYGCYNATVVADDGMSYTAFFTVTPNKGRFNRIRHQLQLRVESAYMRAQPDEGSATSMTAILSASLRGGRVRYRR